MLLRLYHKQIFGRLLQIYKRSVWRKKKSLTIANIFLLVSKCSWSFPNINVLIFLSFSSSLLMVYF